MVKRGGSSDSNYRSSQPTKETLELPEPRYVGRMNPFGAFNGSRKGEIYKWDDKNLLDKDLLNTLFLSHDYLSILQNTSH